MNEECAIRVPSLRAVLFDIDGTLVDTEDIHFATWNEILAEYGMVLDRGHYDRTFVGLTSGDIVSRNFAHLPVAARESLPERKEALFRSKLSALSPTKGLVAFLERILAMGIRVAAVTNAPRANAERMLSGLSLREVFQTLISGEELARGKPDPMPYAEGLMRLGVEAGQALAYEDSIVGVTSAVAAGIATIGVDAAGHHPIEGHPLRAVGARQVVRDFGGEWQQIGPV